jgi:hypothetical protein
MNPARLGLRDHFQHRDHLGRARFGAGPHHPPAGLRDIRAGGYDSLTGLAEALVARRSRTASCRVTAAASLRSTPCVPTSCPAGPSPTTS